MLIILMLTIIWIKRLTKQRKAMLISSELETKLKMMQMYIFSKSLTPQPHQRSHVMRHISVATQSRLSKIASQQLCMTQEV